MTINNKSYSSPKNINLKEGILRFGGTQASNPIASTDYGLYVNASGSLIFSSAGTTTTLGATGSGGGSAPSWDSIFQGDQALQLGALASFTIDRNSGNNDVLTITNTGAGSGDCIQITNAGSGNDIEGSGDTWHFSAAGNMTANKAVFAGDAAADSITLTAGDVVLSDGSLIITDADDAHTLSVTNNSAAADSLVEFAGSGAFTGSTTTSFFTITPSGLETGTAVYLPLAAITEGIGLNIAGGTTQTSGNLVVISSSAAAITDTEGALLHIAFAGATSTNGVLVGIDSNATDETIMLKLTNSDVAAAGTMISLSASAMTTGSGIVMSNLDALTTGRGLYIASASTVIATTGRLFLSSHAGATSTSGILNEFITTATDETILLQLTNATAGQVDGTLLKVSSTGYTTGHTGDVVALIGSGTTGGGSVLQVTSANTTAGQAATITSGVTTTNGSGLKLLCEALTTGVGLRFAHTTSVIADGGSMVRLSDSGVATGGATNGTILDIINTGSVAGTLVKIYSNLAAQTATCLLDIVAAGYTTGYTGSLVKMTGCSTTGSGTVLSVTSANSTAGGAVLITTGATTTNGYGLKVLAESLTTGTGILFAHTTSVIADGGSMLRLTDSGVATGGSTSGTMLDILNTGSVAGTLVKIKSNLAAQTATCLLDVVAAGYTTGYTGSVVKMTGVSTTGSGNVLLVTGANTTAGETVKIDAAAITTGTGLLVTTAGVVITTGNLVSLVANGATTCTGVLRASATALTDGWVAQLTGGGANFSATGGVLNLAMGAATVGTGLVITTSGVYTGTTGLIDINATGATSGTIIDISATGLTTGNALYIHSTTATLSTGKYINCYGTAAEFTVGRYGATVIAGSAIGTAALTITAGDVLILDGGLVYHNKIEDVTSTNVITAAESGTVYYLDSATEFVTTLPAVATSAGVHYTFIVKAAPSGASYTVVTDSSENKIVGIQFSSAGDAGDNGATDDTITFVNGQAVAGDRVEVFCDGALWYAYAYSKVAAGITFTTAS
jgi:hypothetical protein